MEKCREHDQQLRIGKYKLNYIYAIEEGKIDFHSKKEKERKIDNILEDIIFL